MNHMRFALWTILAGLFLVCFGFGTIAALDRLDMVLSRQPVCNRLLESPLYPQKQLSRFATYP